MGLLYTPKSNFGKRFHRAEADQYRVGCGLYLEPANFRTRHFCLPGKFHRGKIRIGKSVRVLLGSPRRWLFAVNEWDCRRAYQQRKSTKCHEACAECTGQVCQVSYQRRARENHENPYHIH
jgi:hypothetical protein